MQFIKNIFVLLFTMVSFAGFAQDIVQQSSPPRLVNDYTSTLTAEQAQSLENKLLALDDSTSTQVTVVIIQSTNGMDVADYAIELGNKWGVGGKKNNNGVVLLIAKGDRKLNISPGYGLEGALTDVTAKQIIDGVIVPRFKGDDYYHGIEEGVDAIAQAVRGEFKAPANYSSRKKSGGGAGRIVMIIVIIVIILVFSGGGNNGGFMSRRGYTGIPPIWPSGGGGGWSGGGGSSGGGGFGGFGGGSFGGGGASGSW